MDTTLICQAEESGARGWWLQGSDVKLFLTEQGGQHAPGNFRLANGAIVQPFYQVIYCAIKSFRYFKNRKQ